MHMLPGKAVSWSRKDETPSFIKVGEQTVEIWEQQYYFLLYVAETAPVFCKSPDRNNNNNKQNHEHFELPKKIILVSFYYLSLLPGRETMVRYKPSLYVHSFFFWGGGVPTANIDIKPILKSHQMEYDQVST